MSAFASRSVLWWRFANRPPLQDLLFQLETTQSQLERLQLDHSRESQYNREGHVREAGLHEQLVQVKTIMVRMPLFVHAYGGLTFLSGSKPFHPGPP